MLKSSPVMFSLSEIIKKLKQDHPTFQKKMEEASAVQRWETVVGHPISKHARATHVKQSILYVEVDHSIWKTELHHRKDQILEKLNQGQTHLIEDLFFVDPRREYKKNSWERDQKKKLK